jgi:hypothetical protein
VRATSGTRAANIKKQAVTVLLRVPVAVLQGKILEDVFRMLPVLIRVPVAVIQGKILEEQLHLLTVLLRLPVAVLQGKILEEVFISKYRRSPYSYIIVAARAGHH